ncbi:MAG: hypothetical protein Q9212_004801 [Teloschistes hypoglaucus]
MPTHLTRRIFRQIIYNALYPDSYCSCRPTVHHRWRACLYPSPATVPSRTLFGFASDQVRKQKPPNYSMGVQDMIQLSQALVKHERPPPKEKLVKAFTSVIMEKSAKHATPMEDSEITLVMATFQYLQKTQGADDELGLTLEEMVYTMYLLVNGGLERSAEAPNLVAFAKLLGHEINRREEAEGQYKARGLNMLAEILASRNRPQEAHDILDTLWSKDPTLVKAQQWTNLLLGFAKAGDQEQMVRVIDLMKDRDAPFSSEIHQLLLQFYWNSARDIDMMMKWYDFGINRGLVPTRRAQAAVLRACSYTNNLEWGEPVMRSYLDKAPNTERERNEAWILILQWAAAKGKGFEELKQLLGVLVQKAKSQGIDAQPDIKIINGLVAMATFRKDAYAAERYLALGRQWGVEADQSTLVLQLEYRLESGDLDGAHIAYDELKGYWSAADEHPSHALRKERELRLVNRLVTGLCKRKPVNYSLVMGIINDLDDRMARLSPDAVSALALVHLQRAELHELVDLLNTQVHRFSPEHRAVVCNTLAEYCLDPSVLTSKIWDAYNILRRTFPELGMQQRNKMMTAFFDRGRSDMATHVFGHMRHLDMPGMRPAIDSYVLCFEGIAKARDGESLKMMHNMLILDNTVEPDTRLYNALMLAYWGCNAWSQSLVYWDNIVHSREGPTYDSIQIALKVCEDARFGERHAKDIWDRLKRFEIPLTKEIYAAYVGALAGRSLFNECVELINNAERDASYTPDVLLLGSFHNALPRVKQEAMDKWASKAYPAAWAEVKKLSKKDGSGPGRAQRGMVYNINRDVRAWHHLGVATDD